MRSSSLLLLLLGCLGRAVLLLLVLTLRGSRPVLAAVDVAVKTGMAWIWSRVEVLKLLVLLSKRRFSGWLGGKRVLTGESGPYEL